MSEKKNQKYNFIIGNATYKKYERLNGERIMDSTEWSNYKKTREEYIKRCEEYTKKTGKEVTDNYHNSFKKHK